MKKLAHWAEAEPHAAHAALTQGLQGRWMDLLRIVPFRGVVVVVVVSLFYFTI